MNVKINITNADRDMLLNVLQNYPSGKVVVEKNKAYWEDETDPSQKIQPSRPQNPIQPVPVKSGGGSIQNMQKYLFDAFAVN